MSAPERDLSTVTTDEWTAAITKALAAHDVKAVAALVQGMAIHHPHEAESIRLTLLLGIDIAKARP